jgi:hypothetical protein
VIPTQSVTGTQPARPCGGVLNVASPTLQQIEVWRHTDKEQPISAVEVVRVLLIPICYLTCGW